MAKIVGRDEQYVYTASCRYCACKFEYTQSETRMKTGSDYSGDTWYYDAMNCPGCGKEIEV